MGFQPLIVDHSNKFACELSSIGGALQALYAIVCCGKAGVGFNWAWENVIKSSVCAADLSCFITQLENCFRQP